MQLFKRSVIVSSARYVGGRRSRHMRWVKYAMILPLDADDGADSQLSGCKIGREMAYKERTRAEQLGRRHSVDRRLTLGELITGVVSSIAAVAVEIGQPAPSRMFPPATDEQPSAAAAFCMGIARDVTHRKKARSA